MVEKGAIKINIIIIHMLTHTLYVHFVYTYTAHGELKCTHTHSVGENKTHHDKHEVWLHTQTCTDSVNRTTFLLC